MATSELEAVQPSLASELVNDFSIQVATVNGSGSQSSNMVLLRSIFQMGIPVSGKNLFPSNIAGLPTWYTIRASRKHYIGRKQDANFLVAVNPETAREDVAALQPGAAVVYDQPLQLETLRSDLIFYPVPFDKLVAGISADAKLRKLVRTMIYVGVLAHLLRLDLAEVESAVRRQFHRKPKAADLNWAAVQAGLEYARQHLVKRDRCRLERMRETAGQIIIDGNSAAALGCLFAGVTVAAWYPITPSSSLCESLLDLLRKHRLDPATGKATFAVIQAEDELAAIGMVIGAGWMGARAMTSTSGPGISLMAEFAGLGYYAEIPAVIFDIQRVGPSTGLPTRTAQGDLGSIAQLSHGDTRHVMLFPGSVAECYEHAIAAFDLAEQLQTPVFVLSDLDLGMNNWMSQPFAYPSQPMRRGKVLSADDLQRVGEFARYRDVDGDGIPWRTLPGTDHPDAAYFTRGSGHNERAQYSERPGDYAGNMDRLRRKFDTARALVPPAVRERPGAGRVGLIAFGSSHYPVLEALDQLRDELGIDAGYLRLRAFPFGREVAGFIESHELVFVVEQNRDAQMLDLLRADLAPELAPRLQSVRCYDGLPIAARAISREIEAHLALLAPGIIGRLTATPA